MTTIPSLPVFAQARVFSGARLHELRTAAGVPRELLALVSGLGVPAIRSYEVGRSVPNLNTAAAVAQVLGCSLDDLLVAATNEPSAQDEARTEA
ncbi:hypothetical protein Ppa06_57950 [Planomonospora parontospora subsp. parontospora]|uniref:HTH cro/C1-type domain-containing protein n=2 Tax=Planomonospora parontospora TaxID=58119 RepID=A0AA37F7J7_9ACTN|nr:helix-turn-helix transcriptional regulator [Planomonospora parontospora]GGK90438.1 hypothetical protein GCM10010126_57360 [Planomonospora parontospora]GII11997.1 hypothetical protein Ppa06_57950 [Planomonospora parontospora subsp. parontospora]